MYLQSSFFISTWKKAMKTYIILAHMFLLLQKHPTNDSQIWPLRSSNCFQQHFQDWFSQYLGTIQI